MPLFNIGFVIFRDVTQLDFTGPLQVLSRLPQSAVHIIAKSTAPVPSDCGLALVPTHTPGMQIKSRGGQFKKLHHH